MKMDENPPLSHKNPSNLTIAIGPVAQDSGNGSSFYVLRAFFGSLGAPNC